MTVASIFELLYTIIDCVFTTRYYYSDCQSEEQKSTLTL